MAFFIWEQRNGLIHERGSYNPVAVVDRARNLRQSFHRKPSVQGPATGVVDDGAAALRSNVPWVLPMEGWYKMNWAVCFHSSSKAWRFGVLVRDNAGEVLASCVGPLLDLPRGVPRGYGAIIQALQFVVEMGFLDVVLEGPSIPYSLEPAGGAQEQSIAALWMEDIIMLKHNFRRFQMVSVSKETNRAVLALVYHSSLCTGEKVWVEGFPVEIQGYL